MAEARQESRSPAEAAEIYGWFTEGFDTKDLQEAEAQSEELESSDDSKKLYNGLETDRQMTW